MKERWAEWLLVWMILLASGMSLFWVLKVPLLQNPDETSHIDYVFSIYSAGRLLNARTPPSAWNVHPRFEGRKDLEGPESTPYDLISHQYTLYLIDATDFQRIRFHPLEKVSRDSEHILYYRELDKRAPQSPAQIPDLSPRDNPWMLTAYPFLYYAVAACFQKLLSVFGHGPAFLFLSVRILSVLFLAGSLWLTWRVLNELRVRKVPALVITEIVALFPLTIFVSASVQPDTLTLLLVLLSFYLSLLLKRRNTVRLSVLLGVALGALLVTKYHIFLSTAVAVLGLLVSEHIFRRRSVKKLIVQLAIVFAPGLLLFMVQMWIVWGAGQITGGNLHSTNTGLVTGIKNALRDYYRGGPAWYSWWGTFGWMDAPLVIYSPAVQAVVTKILLLATLLILALVAFRFLQLLTFLIKLARARRWRLGVARVIRKSITDEPLFVYGFHGPALCAQRQYLLCAGAPLVSLHRFEFSGGDSGGAARFSEASSARYVQAGRSLQSPALLCCRSLLFD